MTTSNWEIYPGGKQKSIYQCLGDEKHCTGHWTFSCPEIAWCVAWNLPSFFSHSPWALCETPALWKPRLHGAGPGVLLLGKWAVISNSNSTEGIETLAQISSLLFLLCEEHFDPCRGSGKYFPIIYKALYTKITCPHTSKRLLMAQVLVQRALHSSVISQPGFSSFPNPTLAFGSVMRFLSQLSQHVRASLILVDVTPALAPGTSTRCYNGFCQARSKWLVKSPSTQHSSHFHHNKPCGTDT